MAGPLEGIRILDFTWVLAGPFATMILSDMGAESLKVEPIDQTWETRGAGPYTEDGISLFYVSLNRGKKSLAVNFKEPQGKEILLRLAEQADVVVENFSPGTMERLGMGYEAMRERNPALIYASISGFGQTGPNRDRPGVDIIMQGYSGMMSITGHPDRGPAKAGVSICDIGAGVWTAIGVLAALVERDRSGQGQYVDAALLDTTLSLMENPIVRYLGAGEIPERMGSRNPLTSPYQAYPCKDGSVVIGGVRDWDHFCVAIDREDLRTDERFNTREGRRTNQAELEPLLSETTMKHTYAEWVEMLDGICLVGPVNAIPDIVNDPSVVAREMIVEVPTPKPHKGTVKLPNAPLKFSRTKVKVDRPAPGFGEHTRDILESMLGMTSAEVDALVSAGVIRVFDKASV